MKITLTLHKLSLLISLFIFSAGQNLFAQEFIAPLNCQNSQIASESLDTQDKLFENKIFTLKNTSSDIKMCENLKQIKKASEYLSISLMPVTAALTLPAVSAQVASSVAVTLATLGISASSGAVLVIGAAFTVPVIIVMKKRIEECEEMDQRLLIEKIKVELMTQNIVSPTSAIHFNTHY